MIHSKEIRLGNLVNYKGKVTKVVPNDIGLLYEYEKVVRTNHHFTPIPLTPEILLKAGFEREDMNDLGVRIYTPISSDTDLCLSWNNGSIWLEEGNLNVIYLHQLQNLYFALTGKELEIQL